jgi:hypothetical protein
VEEGLPAAQPINPTVNRAASAKCVRDWFMILLLFLESFYFLLPMSKVAAISMVIWSHLLTVSKYIER